MDNKQEHDCCRESEHICKELVAALECIEQYRRFIFTPLMEKPLAALGEIKNRLQEVSRSQSSVPDSGQNDTCYKTLLQSIEQLIKASELLIQTPDNNFQHLIMQVMRGFRITCRVLEDLFPFHLRLNPLNQYLMGPSVKPLNETPENGTEGFETGLFHVGLERDPYGRGSASFYTPDTISRGENPPLIVALHGGFGHGRDFIWTWIREARTRKYILMAPTSKGNTWALLDPKEDIDHLQTNIENIKKKWPIDMERILLTGISDGATFALTACVRESLPFSAYAPVAGTLPPGDLTQAKGKRIYWAHGALDWMFPISQARMFNNLLLQSEADITFREIPDLSHSYPREENSRILDWFESG